jgi:hypothetical protein
MFRNRNQRPGVSMVCSLTSRHGAVGTYDPAITIAGGVVSVGATITVQ